MENLPAGAQKQMQQQQQAQEQAKNAKEQRNAMMMQVLDEEARTRLANITAVNEPKAEQIQNIIISNIQRGSVTGKITDQMLIELLE